MAGDVSIELLIVIVNYRTPALTGDCLKSLADEVPGLPGVRVVVTDADSGDDSVAEIGRAIEAGGYGLWCELMPLNRNGGFAYGNNAAIRPALESKTPPRYVLLLNPDTYIRAGAVTELLKYMDANPQVGIAGSRLEHPDEEVQRSAFRFPSPWGEFEGAIRFGPVSRLLRKYIVAPPPPPPDHPSATDWVAGASMIVRREVFDAVGLLDEAYFMYYEEVDFCRRAAEAGHPCMYVPASRVVHLVGQASGVTDVKQRKRRPAYWFASHRLYFRRHYGRCKAFATGTLWVLGNFLFRVRTTLSGRPNPDPPHLIRDYVRHGFRSTPRPATQDGR